MLTTCLNAPGCCFGVLVGGHLVQQLLWGLCPIVLCTLVLYWGGGWAFVLGLAQVGWLKPFPSAQLAVRSATRVVEPTVRMVVSTIPVCVAASSSL